MAESKSEKIKKLIKAKFDHYIQADKAFMAVEDNNEQNALSHAYLSTDSFNK